jgi:predicted ferric reductase
VALDVGGVRRPGAVGARGQAAGAPRQSVARRGRSPGAGLYLHRRARAFETSPPQIDGFRFEPGQFAWITVGKSPFAITRHPFSISSSAEKTGRVAMSIKAAGDFTRKIGRLQPGAAAYLDGPYGAFTVDRHNGPGFVFIGAGVGITPLMSMLRTMADRRDPRPCYLFFGNREWEGVAFREEIEELESRLNLEVVHVLSRPPEG